MDDEAIASMHVHLLADTRALRIKTPRRPYRVIQSNAQRVCCHVNDRAEPSAMQTVRAVHHGSQRSLPLHERFGEQHEQGQEPREAPDVLLSEEERSAYSRHDAEDTADV